MTSALPRKPNPKKLQAIFERLSLFFPLSEGAKTQLDKHCFEFEVSKGQYLLRVGDYSRYVYFIMEGLLTGVATLNNKTITSFISVKGDFVTAIEGLYGICPATEDIKVEEDSLLIGLHVKDLEYISGAYPEVNIVMRKVMELHYKVAHHRSVFFRIGTAADKYDFFLNTYPDDADRIPLELTASFLNIKIDTLKKIVGQQVGKGVELRSHTLSHLLSLYFKQNFNYFINTYRVNFVLSKLADLDCLKQYSLHGLGNEAGFSSSSSFFTEFKKRVGFTPQTYFKQQEALINL